MPNLLHDPRLPQGVGLVLLVVGTLDPVEGSVLIVLGTGVAAVGALVHRSARRALQAWAFGLVAVGVAAMFGLSAVGGLGEGSGRSWAWATLLLPYPVGWALGLTEMVRALRRGKPGRERGGRR